MRKKPTNLTPKQLEFARHYLKTSDPYYSINMAMKYASKKIEYSGGALGFMKEKEFEES